jgi:hypothetical protein
MKSNQLFCYWLQGYFEIGMTEELNRHVIILIKKELELIEEPLGAFTSWLLEVCIFLEENAYEKNLCDTLQSVVKNALNSIFLHVIDNSYDTDIPREILLEIHQGQRSSYE